MNNSSIKISREVWSKVKLYCVNRGITIQRWVEDTLKDAMNNNQSPQSIPVQNKTKVTGTVLSNPVQDNVNPVSSSVD